MRILAGHVGYCVPALFSNPVVINVFVFNPEFGSKLNSSSS